ncbi:MAG TPA: divalent-cation tolerance protein CutA [Kofleriaceae bacterium]|nr:divalent-cation tolerance protein CutA [Kofleriaceae bacterium]
MTAESSAAHEVVLVLSTVPPDDRGAAMARALVEERLAACVNLVPGLRSIYRWQGQVCDDAEALAIIKTTRDRLPALLHRLPALHPYELPEAVAVPLVGGHLPYLAWVMAETAVDEETEA